MGRYDILLQQEQVAPARSQGKPDPKKTPVPVRSSARTGHLSERPNGRTGERPNGRRIITRNSFEIYEDQMDNLRERAFQEKRQGKIGSMSAMVREAIDHYLAKTQKP